jgi:hypothetical protein
VPTIILNDVCNKLFLENTMKKFLILFCLLVSACANEYEIAACVDYCKSVNMRYVYTDYLGNDRAQCLCVATNVAYVNAAGVIQK